MGSFLYPSGGDCIFLHGRLTLALNILGNLGVMIAYILIPASIVVITLAFLPYLSAELAAFQTKFPQLGPIVHSHGRLLPYEFALFVLFCGATHGYTDYAYYRHTYFELGILECLTAAISLAVAGHLLAVAFLFWRRMGDEQHHTLSE